MRSTFCSIAGAASLLITVAATSAYAGANDYAFEPMSTHVRTGTAIELAVRLIHKPSGKPVDAALLFRTRVDMSPTGMAGKTAQHAALPGEWALKLMAKVAGENETVQGTVVFMAK